MPDRVLQAMHRPAPKHLHRGTGRDDGQASCQTSRPSLGRGITWRCISRTVTATWGGRRCVNTLFARGSHPDPRHRAFLPTGFGARWPRRWALECQIIDSRPRRSDSGHGPRRRGAGRADTEHRIKAVLAVQVDTSTSVEERHPRAPRNAGCHRPPGASLLRQHRLPRLRRVPHGRLGRRRDGHGQPERADGTPRPAWASSFFNRQGRPLARDSQTS